MAMSLTLFEALTSLPRFKDSHIVLLLTKLDLLELKRQHSPIHHYFPDFIGEKNDINAAKAFFVNMFLSLNRDKNRIIHVFCANVTDTKIFKPILESIMQLALAEREKYVENQKRKENPKGQVKISANVSKRDEILRVYEAKQDDRMQRDGNRDENHE